jgi:PAS domain-containing protein
MGGDAGVSGVDRSDFLVELRSIQDQAGAVLRRLDPDSASGRDLVEETVAALSTAWEELRVTEEELARQDDYLTALRARRASEAERLRGWVDRMRLAVAVTDTSGMLLEANPEAVQMLGLGRRRHRDVLPQRFGGGSVRAARQLLASAKVTAGPVSGRLAMTPSAGATPVEMQVICVAVPDDDDLAQSVLWVLCPADAPDHPRPQAPGPAHLSAALAHLAAVPVTRGPLPDVLAVLAGAAVLALPHADDASLFLPDTATGATGDRAYGADRAQHALGGGPMMSAARTGQAHVSGDLHRDERWPEVGPELAGRYGYASALAVPLVLTADAVCRPPAAGAPRREVLGVLTVYAQAPDMFDAASIRTVKALIRPYAARLADIRAFAEQARLMRQVSDELASRAIVEHASEP